MPGKGQRRREKNYRAAHGGESRLPPPPKLRELEALPSKLRSLIAIQNKQNTNANASASGGALPFSSTSHLDYPTDNLPSLLSHDLSRYSCSWWDRGQRWQEAQALQGIKTIRQGRTSRRKTR
jgi:hypothetical protein